MELLATLMAWLKEDGFLIVFGAIGLGVVYKGGEIALAHFRRADHSAAAAEEHIAAIAQQLLDSQLNAPEVAKRAHELTNGGPRATSDEILLHLLDHGKTLREIKDRLGDGDRRFEEMLARIKALEERMSNLPSCGAEWQRLADEVAQLNQRIERMERADAAGD